MIGHSFGGLIFQEIADEGASAATVAVDKTPDQSVPLLPDDARGVVCQRIRS